MAVVLKAMRPPKKKDDDEPTSPTWLCPTDPGAVHPQEATNPAELASPEKNERLGCCPPAVVTPSTGEEKKSSRRGGRTRAEKRVAAAATPEKNSPVARGGHRRGGRPPKRSPPPPALSLPPPVLQPVPSPQRLGVAAYLPTLPAFPGRRGRRAPAPAPLAPAPAPIPLAPAPAGRLSYLPAFPAFPARRSGRRGARAPPPPGAPPPPPPPPRASYFPFRRAPGPEASAAPRSFFPARLSFPSLPLLPYRRGSSAGPDGDGDGDAPPPRSYLPSLSLPSLSLPSLPTRRSSSNLEAEADKRSFLPKLGACPPRPRASFFELPRAFYPSPPASVGSAGLYQERERPTPTLWAPGPFPGPFLPAPTRRQPVALSSVDRRRRRHRGAPDAGARRRGGGRRVGGRRVAAADLGRRDIGVRRAFPRRFVR